MGKMLRITSKFHVFMALLLFFVIGLIWVPKSWGPNLCIDVTKVCVDASGPGEPITFSGVVTNCGGAPLEVTVTDDHAGIVLGPITLEPFGGSETYSGSYIPDVSPSTNIVTATGVYSTYQPVVDSAEDTCIIEGDGGDGCTPGYWKNHLENWVGFGPGDDFDTIFGVDFFNPDITLDDAVNLGGGKVKKLARHGTAALISAAHPDVYYPFTVAEVITAVNAGNAEALADANELGCPLD